MGSALRHGRYSMATSSGGWLTKRFWIGTFMNPGGTEVPDLTHHKVEGRHSKLGRALVNCISFKYIQIISTGKRGPVGFALLGTPSRKPVAVGDRFVSLPLGWCFRSTCSTATSPSCQDLKPGTFPAGATQRPFGVGLSPQAPRAQVTGREASMTRVPRRSGRGHWPIPSRRGLLRPAKLGDFASLANAQAT
jgi:hypothetical protein